MDDLYSVVFQFDPIAEWFVVKGVFSVPDEAEKFASACKQSMVDMKSPYVAVTVTRLTMDTLLKHLVRDQLMALAKPLEAALSLITK